MKSQFIPLLLFIAVSISATSAEIPRHRCRVIIVNPEGLFDPVPFGFSQISIDRKTLVAHVAGQTAFAVDGTITGTTFPEQLQAVADNLKITLRAVGASVDDILRVNAFIVDFDPPTDLPIFSTVFREQFGSPVITVSGATALAVEGLLVEIEIDVAVRPNFVARNFPCIVDRDE